MHKIGSSILIGAVAIAMASAAHAQFDLARAQKCSAVGMDWEKANKAGYPGRRKALKAVVDAAKADPVIGACFSEKIQKDLGIAAMNSSAIQGWAAVIKTSTNNLTAAQEQAAADQCPASTLVIAGWNAFYAGRRDISTAIDKSAQDKHKALCGA
jgi:hypothetical protein